MRSRPQGIETLSGLWLVQRIKNAILVGCLASLALLMFATEEPPNHFRISLIAAVCLFCAWAVYRPVLRYVRGERQRLVIQAEAARLDGAALAARTVRHHVGNKLAVAIGYSELLADDPRLPQELEAQALKIMTSALAAVVVVDKLGERLVRVELDTSLAGPPLLDLDASTDADLPPGP
jgi:hypothetical protein